MCCSNLFLPQCGKVGGGWCFFENLQKNLHDLDCRMLSGYRLSCLLLFAVLDKADVHLRMRDRRLFALVPFLSPSGAEFGAVCYDLLIFCCDSRMCRWVIDGFEAASFLDKCQAQILEKDFWRHSICMSFNHGHSIGTARMRSLARKAVCSQHEKMHSNIQLDAQRGEETTQPPLTALQRRSSI